ncbi:hypothetical protein BDF20DRAFT_303890 [Mycotypha africana]|uniref:uncharacterized protein n=1 Tax=Mycotypha africana TaxID=64632 RepID=UPI0023015F3D|nr:uncharacterized protein BDF20DRAFT_303890 [Mycotypha africana]KAI8988059.1 hypothetical protein BDF20DRAFT_303890 [Mycotypha africana]
MKYLPNIFIFYVLASWLFAACHSHCDCDRNDNECITDCVIEANDCVTACKGDVRCYQNCIDDKWPNADAYGEGYNNDYKQILNPSVTVYIATATVTQGQTITNNAENQQQGTSSAAVISATTANSTSISSASSVYTISIISVFAASLVGASIINTL